MAAAAMILVLLAALVVVVVLGLAGVLAFLIAIVATQPDDQAHPLTALDAEAWWWLP